MKITMVHGSNDTYGASRVLLQEVDSLLALGHTVHVLVPFEGPLQKEIDVRGERVQLSVAPDLLVLRRSNFRDALKVPQLPEPIKSADIVVLWTLGMAGYIPLLKLARKKFYVSVHELLEDRRARTAFRLLLWGSFPITTCSKVAAQWLLSLGVRNSRITVTYPVLGDVPIKDVEVPDKVKKESENFTVLVYGRLNGTKGHLEVAKAFQEPMMSEPTWRLILAGAPFPGQEEALDEVLATAAADSRISYVGEVSSLLDIIPKVDLVALFPTKPESFGLVPVEAWSYGIRSIGYAIGGAAEVLPLVGGTVIARENPEIPNIARALAAERHAWKNLEKLPAVEKIQSTLSFQNRVSKLSSLLRSLTSDVMPKPSATAQLQSSLGKSDERLR